MRTRLNEVASKTEELWNFGHIVKKNRVLERADIKSLSMPESITMVNCKSRDWAGIGKELAKKSSLTALEFEGCEETSLFGRLEKAGDVICAAICKSQSLSRLTIGT